MIHPTRPVEPEPGSRVGGWEIVRLLGRGGMGSVYEVRDGETRGALKLMAPSGSSEEVARRFQRELESLSRLHHPNICAVLGGGTHERRPYFVMELLEGRDLRSTMEAATGEPPEQRWERARRVVTELARALAHVHGAGLVHRDLTPANVMLGTDGSVKLMDFGVVKEVGREQLTAHGELLGTVAFIAPEQISGGKVDARTDLYALGSVLYYCLVARRPFHARTLAGYLEKHLHRPPRPPREIDAAVPRDLEMIALRLLQKDPAERFASAAHLLAVLGAPSAGPLAMPGGPRPAGRSAELALLVNAVRFLGEGRSSAILIDGAPGTGRSTLLQLAADQAREAGLGEQFHAADDLDLLPEDEQQRVTEAIRAPSDIPSLWVATCGPLRAGALAEAMANGARGPVQRLPLAALHPAEVEELLVRGLPPGEAVEALARRIAKETEGNPALVTELIHGLESAGAIRQVDGRRELVPSAEQIGRMPMPVPASLRERVDAQLVALSLDAASVVGVLAVAAQEMSVPLLDQVLLLGEAAITAALDELIGVELVRSRSVEHEEWFEVASPRVRDLVASGRSREVRVQLHRRVGEALERAGRRRMHLVVESLATQFEAGELPGKAYPYLWRAGQRRLDRSFFREALEYFDRALAQEPDARETLTLEDADRTLCEVLLRRYEALDHLGRGAEADADLDRARVLAVELDDPRLLARAVASLGRQARQRGDAAAAAEHLAEALPLAERGGDVALRALVVITLAGLRAARGDLDAARRLYVEALALGDASRDEKALAYAYNGLGMVALVRGQSAEARRHFEQSAGIFERQALLAPLSSARVNIVEVHHCTGNYRRGLELAERTLRDAREAHHPLGIARGHRATALILGDVGRAAEAVAEGEEGVDVAYRLRNPGAVLLGLAPLVRALWAVDDREALGERIAEAEELLPRADDEGMAPVVLAWRARLAAVEGDEGRARGAVAAAMAHPGPRWPHQECRAELSLAHAFAAIGDRVEATRRAETAVRRADACGYRGYALESHALAAGWSEDEANVARHRRVAEALAKSLAANLPAADAERFLSQPMLHAARG